MQSAEFELAQPASQSAPRAEQSVEGRGAAGLATEPALKALLVSYAYPPVGGVGVQRVLKLTKYLPQHGVTPAVLTVENPSVPLEDGSLSRDIPAGTRIVRARTLEPGYGVKQLAWQASAARSEDWKSRVKRALTGVAKQLLLPDPQVLWQPSAQRALAARLFSTEADDLVFVTAPPFSQFLLAPLVRLKRGTALVLDYRDEWTTYRSAYEMMGSLSALTGETLERVLVRRAHAITTATDAFRDELLARFPFLDPARVHTIPNGYDPDDFPTTLPDPPTDRFVATYAGTVLKMTSPRGFLAAVRLLHDREPALARSLHVNFLGRVVETERELFDGMERFGVERLGYVEHDKVMDHLARSHLLLTLVAAVPGNERIYPGKMFEYMYLGRPCMISVPTGALTELAARHKLGETFTPDDVQGMCGYLERKLREFREGRYSLSSEAVGIERFSRQKLAGEFARVFREAVKAARS
ncbi:MAG TPA: glycosyltransferase [Polyangiaceae bacterium]|nr:glycosyltransferase [Polyangiaceae bacterium]